MDEHALSLLFSPSQKVSGQRRCVEPDYPTSHQELKRKGETKQLLWQEYREQYPSDGYSYARLCHRYKEWLGYQKRSMRQIHRAGEKLFVDYCGPTMDIITEVINMFNRQTLQHLRSLKLTAMADGLEQQLSQPSTHDELGFEERLALLVDRESIHRQNNKVTRLLKAAKLKLHAQPEDIDYRHPRGLKKSQFADLLSSHWIQQHHNVLITGRQVAAKLI
jgi:hypothetical protein